MTKSECFTIKTYWEENIIYKNLCEAQNTIICNNNIKLVIYILMNEEVMKLLPDVNISSGHNNFQSCCLMFHYQQKILDPPPPSPRPPSPFCTSQSLFRKLFHVRFFPCRKLQQDNT